MSITPSKLFDSITKSNNVVDNDNSEFYKQCANQYASNAIINICNPDKIIYAFSDDDVISAIIYAQKENVAIAVRTGGHSYNGMSSTTGKNIQLDLSRTYLDFDNSRLNEEIISCGISYSLSEFSKLLKDNKCSVPHGVCGTVHLGGHVTTGGSGIGTRMFGLLGDHILSFRIITSDTNIQIITKEFNPDLFFAVLGGGAGYGVVTHVTLKVYKDEDYPCSVGLRKAYLYNIEHLRRILNVFVKWSSDEQLNKNLGCMITVDTSASLIKQVYSSLQENLINILPSVILIDMRWYDDKPSEKQKEFFDEMLNTSNTNINICNHNFDISSLPLFLINYIPFLYDVKIPNEMTFTPISELNIADIELFRRESVNNYKFIDVVYTTNDISVLNNNDFVDNFINILSEYKSSILPIIQFNLRGNKNSKPLKISDNGTSYSHRDMKFWFSFNTIFNGNEDEYHLEYQRKFKQLMIGENGCFSKTDDRMISFPYSINDEGYNLDTLSKLYFDVDGVHDRLLKVKNSVDPNKIFSANEFCVGGKK